MEEGSQRKRTGAGGSCQPRGGIRVAPLRASCPSLGSPARPAFIPWSVRYPDGLELWQTEPQGLLATQPFQTHLFARDDSKPNDVALSAPREPFTPEMGTDVPGYSIAAELNLLKQEPACPLVLR